MRVSHIQTRPATKYRNGLLDAVNFDDEAQAAIGFAILKFRQRQKTETERKIISLANRKAVQR